MTHRRTLFIPTSPTDAYRKWKSYWGLSADEDDGDVVPANGKTNPGLSWSGRLGPGRVYGQADFIPAQGGCVVHLAITGAGTLSRLMLSSPLDRFFWRAAEGFRPLAEGIHPKGAA